MKPLIKLLLAAVMLTAAVSAKAEWVRGYYRNSGTYVQPYYRSTSTYTYSSTTY